MAKEDGESPKEWLSAPNQFEHGNRYDANESLDDAAAEVYEIYGGINKIIKDIREAPTLEQAEHKLNEVATHCIVAGASLEADIRDGKVTGGHAAVFAAFNPDLPGSDSLIPGEGEADS